MVFGSGWRHLQSYSIESLKNLFFFMIVLDPQKATNFAVRFYAHSDQYSCKLFGTRYGLQKIEVTSHHVNC